MTLSGGSLRVVLSFDDAAGAEAARRALQPENADVVRASVEDARLVLDMGPASLGSLVASFEDALACVVAAVGAVAAADEADDAAD